MVKRNTKRRTKKRNTKKRIGSSNRRTRYQRGGEGNRSLYNTVYSNFVYGIPRTAYTPLIELYKERHWTMKQMKDDMIIKIIDDVMKAEGLPRTEQALEDFYKDIEQRFRTADNARDARAAEEEKSRILDSLPDGATIRREPVNIYKFPLHNEHKERGYSHYPSFM